MGTFESIDPFFMQLIIVPVIVIGFGIAAAVLSKRLIIGPIVTLALNFLYEVWYVHSYYPDEQLSFTSWNIYFPIITLFASWLVLLVMKAEEKMDLQ